MLLRFIESPPSRGNQEEPDKNEREAQNMEWPGMRIRFPAEHRFQQMASVMGKPVDVWIMALQPSREEIDGKRKSVHLGKQRDEKPAERAERSPVSCRPRFEEGVGEQDKDE